MLSNARKTRGISRTPARRGVRGAGGHGAPNGAATPDGAVGRDAPDVFAPARETGTQPIASAVPPRRKSSRRGLKDLRVRSRLLLLVVIPTVTSVAAGGVFIASSVQSALVDQRVLTLANLSGKIAGLVQAVQTEREDTVRFIVLGSGNGGRGASPSSATPPGPELSLLHLDYSITTGWANQVKALASGIGGAYSTLAQQDSQATITAIGDLPAIRTASTTTQLPALIVIQEYATAINTMLAVESQIAVGSSDSTLAGEVRVLGLVSAMKEQASQQQALLTSALRSDLVTLGQFGPTQQSAITNAQAQQQGDQNEFSTAATADQRQLFNSALSTSNVVQAQAQEQQAISLAALSLTSSSKALIASDPTVSDASSALGFVVSAMRSVEKQFADAAISRSQSLRSGAITNAIIFSLAVALLLGIALIATTIVGRSMVGPLRRLRSGALGIAETRLPEMVRRMSESDGESIPLDIEPIDVDSTDEIGEVARAFDQVHREAVRLAANESALRGNINAMFVNLSRRSQSLVERQIRVITRLERGEQDSERLANLFQVDHLATRMRRNSENLLVLAGHELSRRWSRPVALVDVLRAAVSEIEHYERVTLNVQPEISVRSDAVSDVVHLTAELVENATSFSAADTPVTIAAYLLSSGGALIEITDKGVGMPAEEMSHANWRLDNPPVVDVAVSRRMGLFVVARLAARHGIRVRLRPAPPGGLTALIWLPDEAITRENGSPAGPQRPASATSGNGGNGAAGITMPERLRPVGQPGYAAPSREAVRDGRNGRGNVASAPRPVPLYADFGTPDPGPQPAVDNPAVDNPAADTDPWTATGQPLRVRGRMRAAQVGAGNGHAGQEPGAQSGAEIGLPLRTAPGAADQEEPAPPTEVITPPVPEGVKENERLPIFDSVESDWFRRGRQSIGRPGPDRSAKSWSSPADEGWRAAEAVHAPAADGTTTAGLPKRAPGANLVPGTAAAAAASGAAPGPASGTSSGPAFVRSAEEMRSRFGSFQRGIRQGRAAAGSGKPTTEKAGPDEAS